MPDWAWAFGLGGVIFGVIGFVLGYVLGDTPPPGRDYDHKPPSL